MPINSSQLSQISFKGEIDRPTTGKRAVITLHGFLTDSDDFTTLYDFLPTVYDKVFKFVTPGHVKPPDFKKFTTNDTFAALDKFFDEVSAEYENIDVIGFSMGGALATYLCSTRKINKAVLLSPANKFLHPGVIYRYIKFYFKSFWQAYTVDDMGDEQDRIARALTYLQPYNSDTRKATFMMLTRLIPYYNAHTLSTLNNVVSRCNANLKQIDTPTLMLWGELDELVPQSSLTYLDQYILNSKTVIFSDLGHMLLYSENRQKLIDEIMDFVK